MTSNTHDTSAQAPAEIPDNEFPIIGVGASAGGLAAFETFFSSAPFTASTAPATPPLPHMAFVLIQHLAPDYKSLLPALIQRCTRLTVIEIQDEMKVRPNFIYVLPAGHDVILQNRTLKLLPPSGHPGLHLPINIFFRSLAQDQHERAIGILLSGTGSDGTQGSRDIKGEGGMVIAQTPSSCEFPGMPQSVIDSDQADYVLPPGDMPAKLITYITHAFHKPPSAPSNSLFIDEAVRKKIFLTLRTQTGHDFSQYKPSTIHRRIERRLAVHQLESIDEYVNYLQQSPQEIEALFRDLLIGVTRFFRDPEAFKILEERVIPKLFNGKPNGSTVRVWVPGCSTGEEAFSIAILLHEHMSVLKPNYQIQVFATDIDRHAIKSARSGIYPTSIANDISPSRLEQFFTAEPSGNGYRIHKEIRESVVFSEQDLIKDPPFSKLDLISCRNLLIYMTATLQKRLIPLFHYSLKPDGFLFLGPSETVGEYGEQFSACDRKWNIYQREDDIHSSQRAALARYLTPITNMNTAPLQITDKKTSSDKLSLRELTEQAILKQSSAAGALINGKGDILYLHGRTGMYLEIPPGKAEINNILKISREGLQHELAHALRKAVNSNEPVRCPGLRVKTNGHYTHLNLTVSPVPTGSPETPSPKSVTNPQASLYLVLLEEAALPDCQPAEPGPALGKPGSREDTHGQSAHISELQRELRAKEEYLQSTNEELETSNEELKSLNEELETSKEELQSTNEELSTVNAEMQAKVTDLLRANNDMNNLLSGTGIATIFLDRQMCILRFTPAVTQIINLLPGDIGRPVNHFLPNLIGYNRLAADAQDMLKTLTPKELEVQSNDGKWFVVRMLPYRTLNNVVEGAVVTFVDITEHKLGIEALREAESKFRALFEQGPIGVAYHKMIYDTAGNPVDYYFLDANESYQKLTGVDPRGKTVTQAFPGIEKDSFNWIATFGKVARTGESTRFEQHLDINNRWYDCVCYQNKPDHFVVAFLDITDRKIIEKHLEDSNLLLAQTFEQSPVAMVLISMPDAVIRIVNPAAREILDISDASIINTPLMDFKPTYRDFDADGNETFLETSPLAQALAGQKTPYQIRKLQKSDGSSRWHIVTGTPIINATGNIIAGYLVMIDITDRKRAEAELLKMQKLQSIATLAGGIAHDFNNILMGLFGNVALAKTEIPKDHPGFKPLIEAEKSMGRAIRLTKQLLTFAKGGDPVRESVSLSALIEEVAQFDLTGSNVQLIHQHPATLWSAHVDKGQIQQVISNLTINARQAMPEGGHLYIELENAEMPKGAIPGLHPGKYIKLTVTDEGSGIDSKSIDRIFDPYFTTKTTGSGLGLATVYSIITKHHGHISVTSLPGKGSTFTVYLPACEEPPPLPIDIKPALSEHSLLSPPAKVMLLDDEEVIRTVIPRWLHKWGYSVETAQNGHQAIDLYKQSLQAGTPFDVIILDLTIPGGIGGQEVVKAILALDPNANAIASSGYSESPIMSQFKKYGFKGVIAKPYTQDELRVTLERALRPT